MTNPSSAVTGVAAWSDGELIGSLLNGAVDLFIARGNQHTTTAIETRMADQYAELHRRLAAPPSGQVCVSERLIMEAAEYIVPRGQAGHRIKAELRAALKGAAL